MRGNFFEPVGHRAKTSGHVAQHWMKHPKEPRWFRIPFWVYRNLVNGGMMDGERVAEINDNEVVTDDHRDTPPD
jgi:hypothetical protein